MLRSVFLKTVIVVLLTITFFAPLAEARLMAGGPETVIANSTLILTGKVTENMEAEEERTFAVKIDRIFKGNYQKEEIVLTEKKNHIYGWVHIRCVPDIGTKLLLFLRSEDNVDPFLAFDLNCIAVVEGQEVTGLLGGSNVGINDGHWEIEDYVKEYNVFFNSADLYEIPTGTANTTAGGENAVLYHNGTANRKSLIGVNDGVSTQGGSSIGVIGSADGPTAIHILGNPLKALMVPAIVLAATFLAIGFAVGYIVKGRQTRQVK
ncbi:MAG TPA: hypothetical protein GXZ24_04925 [Firmicutes bacterium]|nr:hypothetical protein [Bacillota bacterium]